MQRWVRLRAAYRRRTRQLFDPETGRFRDWLIQEARFQEPRPDQPYWGVDACRYSPLGLTPLLLGRLGPIPEHEIWRHAMAPWTAWPSWTYVLAECAAAARLYEPIGELASEIIDRVYRMTDRRSLADISRPLPCAAPEFWPHDWRRFQGRDAYGWGATTANLLIRHVFGL